MNIIQTSLTASAVSPLFLGVLIAAACLIRLFAVFTIGRMAQDAGRNAWGWGVFALFLPELAFPILYLSGSATY